MFVWLVKSLYFIDSRVVVFPEACLWLNGIVPCLGMKHGCLVVFCDLFMLLLIITCMCVWSCVDGNVGFSRLNVKKNLLFSLKGKEAMRH